MASNIAGRRKRTLKKIGVNNTKWIQGKILYELSTRLEVVNPKQGFYECQTGHPMALAI